MASYVANVHIKEPIQGVSHESVTVPPGFKLLKIIAFIPVNSLLDIKDNNRSIFGKSPIGGGLFNTLSRSLEFPEPVAVETTELDVYLEILEQPADPVFISFVGQY